MKAKGLHTVMYGKDAIDISGLEQLVDDSQTNALTVMMNYFRHHLIDNHKSLIEATNQMYDLIDEEGIEAISNFDGHPGNLALRKQEFIGTLNRYRGLKVK